MSDRIYFDNSATTPLDPRVTKAMEPYFAGIFGNPSSLHWAGREARAAIDQARQQVADLFNAHPKEIIFTASGTESDNLALIGVIEGLGQRENHLITSAIEHPAILETTRYLERQGVEVTYLDVDGDGLVDPNDLQKALRPTTRLVSIMAANNVVGTLQPITELARITHEHGALFHTDAVQAVGKIPLNVKTQPIDLLSLSAHKLHGPKGVGALYVRSGVSIKPLVHGGGQERGLRSATENVAGLVGLGQTAEIARAEMSDEASRLVQLRDQLIETITTILPNTYLIGHRYRRLPGHVCLGLAGQEGEAIKLLLALDEAGIAISTGSACSAHQGSEPSYILRAMGFDLIRARGSLRITLGRFNTAAEVDRFLIVLPQIAADLRPITSRHFVAA
ncbi:cysteine desulfurase [Thermoflexales bacterium]|nr:cysteine desulfurase [Thermoflexales bacterium]